jgi:hypothetical protein
MDAHPHDPAAPWQIEWMPLVPTMLSPTQLTTIGTRDRRAGGIDDKDQIAVRLDDHQDDAPALRL